jgi:hypothetical protein
MRVFITIGLDDHRGIEPLPATPGNPPVSPCPDGHGPLAAFVAQMMATHLQVTQTRVRRCCAQDNVSRSYTAGARLSWLGQPTLDRSV